MLPLPAPRHGTVWLCCGGTLSFHRGSRNKCCSRCYLPVLEKALFCSQRCSLSPSSAFHFFFFLVWFPTVLCAVSGHPGPRCPTAMSLPMAACSQSCSARGKRGTRQLLSAPTCHTVGKLLNLKRCPCPLSQQCCFVLGEKCTVITWVPGSGRDKQGCKEHKHTSLPDSLSTPRQRGSQRENMCKTKKCGQAGTIKFQYRKWSWCHFNVLSSAKNSKLCIKIQCKTPTNSQVVLVEKLTFMENMHGNMPEECVVLFPLLILNTLVQRAIPF